jgi:hypothetical protein
MNPDSTTPPPEDEQHEEADLPGWTPSRSSIDQLDPTRTTVTDLPPALSQTPEFGEHPDELDDLEQRERISPRPEATSRRSVGDPSIASAAAGLFALAAQVVSLIVNATVGHGSGAYVMQPEEAQAIGEPLGRIASRHAPIGDGDVTDIGDGITAGVATAAYAARATTEHFAGRTPPEATS